MMYFNHVYLENSAVIFKYTLSSLDWFPIFQKKKSK